MTRRVVTVIEWECDSCGRTILTGDDLMPDGWYDDVAEGTHWCGCARTVEQLERLEAGA